MKLKNNIAFLFFLCPIIILGQYNSIATIIEPTTTENLFSYGRSSAMGDFNGDGITDMVIADPNYSEGSIVEKGRVYLFWGNKYNSAFDYTIIQDTNINAYANFGRFLKSWDLNRDGFDDLIIPAFRTSIEGFRKVGKVFVFYGSKEFDTQPDLVISSPLLEDAPQFGSALSIGDLNGDSHWDLVIGAHLGNPSGVHDAGCAFVYFGSVNGFEDYPSMKLTESVLETYPYSGPEFGRDIAICDFNKDGYDDLFIAAAWGSVDSTVWAGRISIFLGGLGFDSQVDHVLIEKEPGRAQILGWSLTCADLNADGYDDLIAGAPRADVIPGTVFRGDSVGTEGRINIFWGSGDIQKTQITLLAEAVPQLGAHLGRDGLIAMDINRDGQTDILAAAPYYDNNVVKNAGRISVFLNIGNGFVSGEDILLPGTSLTGLSLSVSPNGDGLLICGVNQAIWFHPESNSTGVSNRYTDTKFITLYPNPVGDKLHIVVHHDSIQLVLPEIRVQNFYLQVLRQNKFNGSGQVDVDLTGLPSGVYMVSLYSGGKLVSSSSFIHE